MAMNAEDLSSPLRQCRICGEQKPWNEAHFGRRSRKRADGSTAPGGWYWECKPCRIQKANEAFAAGKVRKKLERQHAAPPPLYRALQRPGVSLPPPPPAEPSFDFRGVLQSKAKKHWPKLADKMITTALGGGKDSAMMLKLVTSYVLGPPKEAAGDDDGPGRFWKTLLAGPGPSDFGAHPDVGDEDADLEHDPGAAG